MRHIGITLRPHDERNLRIVMEYIEREGLQLGKGTVSQAVRYTLGYTAGHCACHGEPDGARGQPTPDSTGQLQRAP